MEVVVLTAVIEMTPDSYSVKFIFPGFLGSSIYPLPVILGAVKTCDTPPPPVQLMGRRGKRFALGQLTMRRRTRMMRDCRVMGHWLFQTGDSIAVHHLLSGPPDTESSTLPALLSDHFFSPEDPFLQACPWR